MLCLCPLRNYFISIASTLVNTHKSQRQVLSLAHFCSGYLIGVLDAKIEILPAPPAYASAHLRSTRIMAASRRLKYGSDFSLRHWGPVLGTSTARQINFCINMSMRDHGLPCTLRRWINELLQARGSCKNLFIHHHQS